MRKVFLAILIAFLSTICVVSQKRHFELADVVPGGESFSKYYPRFAQGNFAGRQFMFNSNDTVWAVDGANCKFLTTRQKLNNIVSKKGISISNLRYCTWIDEQNLWIWASNGYYRLSLKTDSIVEQISTPDAIENVDLCKSTSNLAYTIGNNLFVANRFGSNQINVDEAEHVIYGQAVHRNEFGINGGTFWSTNGTKLAFYRMDESMVADYPIVDVSERIAKVKPIKYPMAGCESHQVSIGIFNTANKSVLYLKTESPLNRYFTNIAWTPDDKLITVAEINREQNHMWFNVYDSETGEFVKTLFEESDNCWVEPCFAAKFIGNSSKFVWQSKRDGYNHLYIYDIIDDKCCQLTSGEWNVTNYYGTDAACKNIYVQTTAKGYLERHIYKVNIKTGAISCLTDGVGVHEARFNSDCSAWIDDYSSMSVAKRSTYRCGKSKCIVFESVNPYQNFEMPEIKLVDLKSADGKYPLTGRVILPTNFDESKKYPVIVYVYGGPHSQMVDASWLAAASTWMLYFAQQGYIVFTMDNRGTDGHGKDFEQAIHRQLNRCEMADQMCGVEYLKSLPYVDSERIGIHGWSYGGFMTVSMILNQSDVFKVAVAGGPVIDWSKYEVMYGERYMDSPAENPDGYAANNLCSQIQNLKGRLLVIHGDVDPVVVWQNSLSLLKSSVDKGVQIDYAVYPGHKHNVVGPDRVHLIAKILRYFDDFLK